MFFLKNPARVKFHVIYTILKNMGGASETPFKDRVNKVK